MTSAGSTVSLSPLDGLGSNVTVQAALPAPDFSGLKAGLCSSVATCRGLDVSKLTLEMQ